MTRFPLPSATGVLLLGTLLASACDRGAPSGPAVVAATVLEDDAPVPGATVELRLPDDSSATAVTDSAGRVRVEMADAEGPAYFVVARDTAQPRPERTYAPVLLAPGDSAVMEVRLDRDRGHRVRYMNDTRMARWGRAAMAVDAIERDHYAARREWVMTGQRGEPAVDFRGVVDSVRAWLETEQDPEVRSALWLAVLTAGPRGDPVTVAEAERALVEMAPNAAIWAQRTHALASMVGYAAMVAEDVSGSAPVDGQDAAGRRELAHRRTAAYLDRVVEAYPDTLVQPIVLLEAMRLADRTGRIDAAMAYYDRLLGAHPGSRAAEAARGEEPGTRLKVDSPIPDVPLPALDSTAPPITPAELAGPATLVDFWAAWCTPCVAEMPVIHEAYDRFRDRGFDVVSISYDASRDDVARFRERYPMPWRHSFVGAEALSDGQVAAAWGVNGLPSAFLVGSDGTIIALEGALRGEALIETLARVLGE